MEQKIKFLVIGLLGILVISGFFTFQSFTAKQTLEKERNGLMLENDGLKRKAEESLQKVRGLEDRIGSLNRELDKVSRDKQEIEKKYELVNRERTALAEKLESRRAGAETPTAKIETQTAPQNVDAYWAQVLKAKTDLELQLGKLRDELKSVQINNEELQRQKGTLDLDMNNLQRDKEDLKRQLDYNQKLLESISQELVREKNDKIQIQDGLKSIKSENAVLRRQLDSLANHKVNLERKLQELREEKSGLENQLAKMDTTFKEKVSKISDLKQDLEANIAGVTQEAPLARKDSVVELPPIVVRPKITAALQDRASKQEGSILAINRENNFVIIDLGQDLGIKVGDALEVFRQGRAIAAIEVIQARRNIAACDIKKETEPVKIGDIVR